MMKRVLLAAACLSALIVVPGCDDLETEVRDTFAQYSAARNNRDLNTVLEMTDPKYIDHLDYIVKMARTGEKDRVLRMTAAERLQLVMMRNRLTKAELAAMDGKGWLGRKIQEGWTRDFDEEPELQLGEISIKRPRAFASLVVDGADTPFKLEFVKTGDKWVIDPTPYEELINQVLRKIVKTAQSEDAFILNAERAATGKPVNAMIWETPK
jgi:hypothetical protein